MPLLVFGATLLLGAPSLGRWFDNPDDWEHLDMAHRALTGQPGAWSDVLVGDVGIASVRPVGALLWAWDQAVWGWTAGGFFLSNLMLMGVLAALVAVLVGRATRSAGLAAAAGAMAGLSVVANQPMYYLASRDDLLATVLMVGAVLAWVNGRDSARGRTATAVLAVLAALSKPTAVLLPVALVVLEWTPLAGRRVRTPVRLLTRQAPILVGLAAYLVLLAYALGFAFDALMPPTGGAGGALLAAKNALMPHLLPMFVRHGQLPMLAGDALRLGLIALGLGGAWHARSPQRGLLVLGAALLAIGTAPVLPFLAGEGFSVQDDGRYLQLPVVGLALMLCGAVAGWTRARERWGWAMAALSVSMFFVGARPMLGGGFSPSRALFEALEEAPGPALVGVSRLDAGVSSMLLSDAVLAYRGGGEAELFLQGSESLYRGGRGGARFRYGAFEPAGTVSPATFSERVVLMDGQDEAGMPRFSPVVPSQRVASTSKSWSLEASVVKHQRLPPHALWRAMHYVREFPSVVTVPGDLEIVTRGQCSAVLELTAPSMGRRGGPAHSARGPLGALVPSGRFALLLFSAQAQPEDPGAHWLVAPLQPGSQRQTVTLDLTIAPGWDAVDVVRWLAVLPSNQPGQATVHRLGLIGCGE